MTLVWGTPAIYWKNHKIVNQSIPGNDGNNLNLVPLYPPNVDVVLLSAWVGCIGIPAFYCLATESQPWKVPDLHKIIDEHKSYTEHTVSIPYPPTWPNAQ